jgi:hypothetical protein
MPALWNRGWLRVPAPGGWKDSRQAVGEVTMRGLSRFWLADLRSLPPADDLYMGTQTRLPFAEFRVAHGKLLCQKVTREHHAAPRYCAMPRNLVQVMSGAQRKRPSQREAQAYSRTPGLAHDSSTEESGQKGHIARRSAKACSDSPLGPGLSQKLVTRGSSFRI